MQRIGIVEEERHPSSSPETAEKPLGIVARGLTKSFDGGLVHALRGTDLEIQPGERIAITGPTGCGKSTLLSILALLERQDGGELIVGGRPAEGIRSPERWRGRHLGIVFQFHHLLPHLTVEENVMLPLVGVGARSTDARRRARSILRDIGLAHRARFVAEKLSGGERQMTAVARALAGSPGLILADEPTGNVDSKAGDRVLELLFGRRGNRPATVVVVTHNDRVAGDADRILRMRDGRIDGRG